MNPSGVDGCTKFKASTRRRIRGVAAFWILCLAVPVGALAQAPPRLVADVGHADTVTDVAFSQDGQKIATAGRDRVVVVWDKKSGQQLLELRGHIAEVLAVAFSPDGKQIATGSEDDTLRLWEASTGKPIFRFHEAVDGITSVAWMPDGKRLVAASRDKNVYVFDVNTKELVKTLEAHTADVMDVAVSKDGKRLATASWDGKAILWDTSDWSEFRRFEHPESVEAAAFSPDGRILATAGTDKIARLWDIQENKLIRELLGHEEAIETIAYFPDGKRLLTGGVDQTVRIWNAETGKEIKQLPGHQNPVQVAELSPDGNLIVTSAGDQVARVFDAQTEKVVTRLGGLAASDCLAFSKDGKLLVTGGRDSRPIARVWNLEGRSPVIELVGHEKQVLDVAISDDGTRILTGSLDTTAKLWDAITGKELRTFAGPTHGVIAVALSPDGKLAAMGGGKEDSTVHVWRLETGEEILSFEAHKYGLQEIVFSPNSKHIATAGWDQTARIWDAATGQKLHELPHDGFVSSVAYLPGGKQLVSGCHDKRVRVWDAETGQLQKTLQGHTDGVLSVAGSSDGKLILSGGERLAILWDAERGTDLGNLDRETTLFDDVAFYPGNKHAATTGLDGVVRFWEVKSRRELCRLMAFQDGTWAVVDKDGRYDAANAGDINHLHWVIGDERVALNQLKERYYDPGLLGKYLGLHEEPPRDVGGFRNPKLFPTVELQLDGPSQTTGRITAKNQGGGIGKIVVWLNGKEITSDARPRGSDPNEDELTIALDFTNHPALLPGQQNSVRVMAYNAEGYLSSRGLERIIEAPGEKSVDPPTLWAVIAGVSDYQGDRLDLRYAAKDAEDVRLALEVAAKRLFGAEHVQITLLAASPDGKTPRPSRANLEQALKSIQQAKPKDIIVVYLAGHGVSFGGQDGDYYYLTSDAESANLTDPEVRRQIAFSSAELFELLNNNPASKQVLILDTCASGTVFEKLSRHRAISSSQVRALERLKDRAGVHILAGCAADRVSYETSRFGQGLLTYSLLLGMRGGRLREGEYVDVVELFGFAADQVPLLARDIGGIQSPQLASPEGGASFDIGQVTPEDRSRIPVHSPKPVIVQARIGEQNEFLDVLGLEDAVNERLRSLSAESADPPLHFVDAKDFAEAYRIEGRYIVEGQKVAVAVKLFQDRTKISEFELMGQSDDVPALATQVVLEIQTKLSSNRTP